MKISDKNIFLWSGLPNTLTVARLILTCFFIYFIWHSGLQAKGMAFVIFILASLTDFGDGYLAKKYNLVTDFGKLMDPIADKFLILSAFFIFARMQIIPLWMFLIVLLREVLITMWRFMEMNKGNVLAAEGLGKYKTVSQIFVICLILTYLTLLELPLSVQWTYESYLCWVYGILFFMLVTVALTLVSGVLYIWNNRGTFYAR